MYLMDRLAILGTIGLGASDDPDIGRRRVDALYVVGEGAALAKTESRDPSAFKRSFSTVPRTFAASRFH